MMRQARIYMHGIPAGVLSELTPQSYRFVYDEDYTGPPISLTMPVKTHTFLYETFPPFFEGLLPEGSLLEALLKKAKLDRDDLFGQLIQVGDDVVGAVTIEAIS